MKDILSIDNIIKRIITLLEDNESTMLKRFYKYFNVNDYFFDSLTKKYLWFSKPLSFNDPFEFLFCYNNITNPKVHADKRNEINNYMDTFGVLCLSDNNNLEDYDAVLMWSHYANKHTGILLGFDFEYIYDQMEKEHLVTIGSTILPSRKIEYLQGNSYPPKIPASPPEAPLPNDIKDIVNKILFSKACHWKYESEYRVLMSNIKSDNERMILFNNDNLREIIFGCKSTEKVTKDVIKIAESNNIKCVFKKAEINLFKGTLSYKQL